VVEVLIAGAGPAGAVAATILARAGVRVLLVDRARFPREKLCGDTLNPGTVALLDRLGLARRMEPQALHITGMIVSGPGGVQVRAQYDSAAAGRSLTRRDLDAALLGAAIDAGARFEEGVSVRAPLLCAGRLGPEVRGATIVGRDGRAIRLPAAVTIAADGRRSTLGFALQLTRHPRRPRRWAVGGYFENVGGLTSNGEMHVRPGHYLGVAPLPGGLANACLVTSDRRGFDDPLRRLREALAADRALAGRFAAARPIAPASTLGPLAVDTTASGMPGLLLAGDAAGFIDPMTGDGLRFAIRGAELAAQGALEVLQHGAADAHVRLARRRAREFGRKWRLNRALRVLVDSEAGVRIGGATAIIAPGLIRALVRAAGDVGR
jgi:menaquinone-9 beta-reductase